MKLTKGRIRKLLKSHRQTISATPPVTSADSHYKRASTYFTRRSKKSLNTMNKTMCRPRVDTC